jgi:soluble lytic murein transglycosylase-like protein
MKFLILLILLSSFTFANDWNKVEKVCKRSKYKDCSLVKAIITVESGNNPLSIGRDGKGSLGLMQIKCSTAQTLDRINKRKQVSCNQLFNPYLNVMYGIEYLNYLEKLLNTPPSTVELLSAYNGGYLYHKPTGTYRIKKCNKISKQKKRKCNGSEPFNVEYSKKVIRIYNKIRS